MDQGTVVIREAPFIPALSAGGGRRSHATAAARAESTTPCSATAKALLTIIEASEHSPEDWLNNEILMFNVKINRKTFPRENGELVRTTFDNILGLATSLPPDNPLAFPAYAAYVLFPRLILRSLPPGCKGKHAAAAFARRCAMFCDGQIAELINEAHDSQVTRVACRVHALTVPTSSFPLAARAASLAGCGAVGKACKLAFSYGTESDPIVAATFLAKLTRTTPHTHTSHLLHPPSRPPLCRSRSRPSRMRSLACRRSQRPIVTVGLGSSSGTRPTALPLQPCCESLLNCSLTACFRSLYGNFSRQRS